MPAAPPVDRSGWRFWIDRGGTFTDLVGCAPTGELVVRKVLSVQPDRPDDPAVRAIREVLGLPAAAAGGDPLPPGLVQEVRLGTTVATNALLERRGVPTLLLVNRGFADLLRIGDQHRPDLFALRIERPDPLEGRVLEVPGRLAADGQELEPLDLAGLAGKDLEVALRQAQEDGYRSVAVALLHAYRHPRHELQLGAWLERLGFASVALSHRVSPLPRLVPRAQTTVLEAYLGPVLDDYLRQVRTALGEGVALRVMQSSGGLIGPEQLRAKDTILSGPAGGLVGAVRTSAAAGFSTVVGFDMGGTSTDVCYADGVWERREQAQVAGFTLQAPMLEIHTVAAGGGSVISADGQRLRVGPASAGADPGPACYRRGGPLTLTDANLLLGRLQPEAFPALFGPEGDQPLDAAVVGLKFEALGQELAAATQVPPRLPESLAEGALAIAVERMAEAIRRISIQQGHDVRHAALCCFGGAGGQHACALAEALGIRQVLLHPLAGVLSAYGIGLAEERRLLERTVRRPLTPELLEELTALREELMESLAGAPVRDGVQRDGDQLDAEKQDGERSDREHPDRERPALECYDVQLQLRTPGSDSVIPLPWSPLDALLEGFASRYEQRFGYRPMDREGQPLRPVVERLSVERIRAGQPLQRGTAAGPGSRPDDEVAIPPDRGAAPRAETRQIRLYVAGGWCEAPLLQRGALGGAGPLPGPALIVDPTGTNLLLPGWSAELLAGGELLFRHEAAPSADLSSVEGSSVPGAAEVTGLRRQDADGPELRCQEPDVPVLPCQHPGAPEDPPAPDPVLLELFHNRFAAIAEQMGTRLQLTSSSVNIRERLDFSCAVFDGAGALVANAPHIPVHLGSMGESVVALLAAVRRGEHPPLSPGDAVVTNNPFNGGTHLPDITVITPVFAELPDSRDVAGFPAAPVLFVASRGHHADVGGITPGSMPSHSRRIDEEGLLLDNVPLLRDGVFQEGIWRERLEAGPWPVRNPDQLLADLQAQVAANRLGVERLQALIRREGLPLVQTYLGHVQRHAAEAVRCVIDRLHDGAFRLPLDDGLEVAVAITVDRAARRARIDFSGTSPQQTDGNLNAPLAITKAVVLYVFRCLVDRPIPLNAGCFEPLELVVPEGCLLHPRPPAAVVAGNVETSQAVANALFGALGVMAAAQGTMNNLSFGNARCQYYETICGGTGAGLDAAGRGFAGADAVQSHMTNSRLTDPEILEERFPVRLEQFAIRRGSGGGGHWRGGDGVVRQLRFLEPMTVSLLSGSRRVAPFGLAGGGAAALGRNRLQRADGAWEELGGRAERAVDPGDRLRIETPGGGGYGT
ncbi:hydantoinase B/oxoprolinase family protein [Vulcanococcus limneticus]|uniref:hydantoinase B/oxoprolinase family protein n=1 Tax=Vulcanococcus limneticus TaxID=2170428 RepID=UPI00398C1D6E